MGNMDSGTRPQIIPALQYKSVISVVLGDYHYAALTSDGKLLTWGTYSKGALGLGDPAGLELGTPGAFATADDLEMALSRPMHRVPPNVETPTEVRFDHFCKTKPRERFCITVTAAGWHTAALVMDTEVSLTRPYCFFLASVIHVSLVLASQRWDRH
jgi:SCF-associated factor 1